TLRSERMKTRLPRRSTSVMRLNLMTSRRTGLFDRGERADFGEHRGDVEHPVGEAPLVVVPRVHLHQVAFGDLGERGLEDRAGGIVIEVRGDERLGAVLKNALEIAVAGL